MLRSSLLFAAALSSLAGCAGLTSGGGTPPPAPAASTPALVAPVVAARLDERPSRRSAARKILPHNVRVMAFDGDVAVRSASGVAVGVETGAGGTTTYILTNDHVVDPSDLKKPRFEVIVEHQAELSIHAAEPVARGSVPEMDLGLLQVKGLSLPPVTLADDAELELGEDVLVAGAPYGKAISLSGGMISQVEWDRGSKEPVVLKTDAPIGYGASGGGIYSVSTGKLLAIVEGYRTAKINFAVADQPYSFDVPMPGETFAAPTAKVRTFLRARGFQRLLEPRPATSSSEVARTAVR